MGRDKIANSGAHRLSVQHTVSTFIAKLHQLCRHDGTGLGGALQCLLYSGLGDL